MLGIFSVTSCGDMLETDNDSGVINPSLDSKTDSVFYALGIAQAMQQLADQYFFIGEMRGDLVTTTTTTNTHLRALADYSATTANKYDSAYVYYKVINNCNYYLANRDTTLYTGATNVTLEEYAAVAAMRAWAYLQLARTYGGSETALPFFTQPLMAISQINDSNIPKKNLKDIVNELAPSLARFSGFAVPTFGTSDVTIGTTNWGSSKHINPKLIFIPVDVILGEMYLEVGEYANAAKYYSKYLCDNQLLSENLMGFRYAYDYNAFYTKAPEDMGNYNSFYGLYLSVFTNSVSPIDVISLIPMAVSSQRGQTTDIPVAFGYDYYSTDQSSICPRTEDIQIAPSSTYYALTDSSDFYYYPQNGSLLYPKTVSVAKLGDGRSCYSDGRTSSGDEAILNKDATDTTKVYIGKARTANIFLFRTTTIYLHLAEALNRMGYPELAFAILRNGISTYLEELVPDETTVEPTYKYMTAEAINLLKTQVPFLDATNRNVFKHEANATEIFGIHSHGATSYNYSRIEDGMSVYGSTATAVGSAANLLYLPKPIIGAKMQELSKMFPDITMSYSKEDSINAMEDLLCDEYAKEFAFEGVRFYDLQRIARHKNESGLYGSNFGSRWFAKKMEGNNPQVNLLEPKNWYLPFE